MAHAVIAGRGSEAKGLMGPLQVVDVPPAVESRLAVGQIGEATPLQDFSCNGPVKALVLSLGLWAVGSSMANADTQAQHYGVHNVSEHV